MLPPPLAAGGGGGEREPWLVRLPMAHLVHASVSLPLVAFFFCVAWSLLYHFDASTATHCGVWNLLPSISAAIGGFTPQRYVWRTLLGLHAPPRLLLALAYLRRYRSHPPGTAAPLLLLHRGGGGDGGRRVAALRLPRLAFLANLAELGGLLGLTNVSSNENHDLHKLAFVTFILGAACYMLLTCRLWSYAASDEERRSYLWKRRLAVINLLSSLLAVFTYTRHNRYCEPGVYTLFALCEYAVVFSNIAFHWTAVWDFSSLQLLVGPPPPDKRF
ncbi:post-GPI attachment to proteins factor 2 [Lethenteron reissneri]|uniref:post-GPI attachment to proteins factor 2 n=1 Tax=Lethenteron reissneri TaxID=7753 RepID=UPI002AB6F729|nr:post-GPI attachment to proteins factor 2 [Lethenteron reissneri]